jgi:hypothetical protein
MTSVRIALALGATLLTLALGLTVLSAPLTVAGTNGVPARLAVAAVYGRGEVICERGGTLPQGTTAIRVSLSANIGPRVSLRAVSGGNVVTEGEHEAGWGVDETVTVPVTPVPRTIGETRICTTIGQSVEPTQVNGALVRLPSGASAAWLRMEYLRPGAGSWLSRVPSIARDMGLAHAPEGTWVAYLTIAAMCAVCALAFRLALRELR